MGVGIGFINGISIAFASFATQSQPLWITASLFLTTALIGAVATYCRIKESYEDEEKQE